MEIKPSLHETEFKNCFGIYSKNQNLKFDKKFYDNLVDLNFFVKEEYNNERLIIHSENNLKSFELVTFFNNTSYHLNPKIYEYLYDELDSTISNVYFGDIEYFIEEIKLKLESFTDKIKRNDFLDTQKINIINSIENYIDYQNYIEKNSTSIMNFGSWKEYVKYSLSYENDIILDFLFGSKIIINNFNIYKDWTDNYIKFEKLNFLKSLSKNIDLQKTEKFTLKEKICILEQLITNYDQWEDYSDNKKGIIVSILFNQSKDNSRKFFNELSDKNNKLKISKINDEAMKKLNSLLKN